MWGQPPNFKSAGIGETLAIRQNGMEPSSSSASARQKRPDIAINKKLKRNSFAQPQTMTASASAGYAPNVLTIEETDNTGDNDEPHESCDENTTSKNWRIRKLFNGSQLVTLKPMFNLKDIKAHRRPQSATGRSFPDCTSSHVKLYGRNKRIAQQYQNRQSLNYQNNSRKRRSEQWAKISLASTSMWPAQTPPYHPMYSMSPYGENTMCAIPNMLRPWSSAHHNLAQSPLYKNFAAHDSPKKWGKKNKEKNEPNHGTAKVTACNAGQNSAQNGTPSTSQSGPNDMKQMSKKARKNARKRQRLLENMSEAKPLNQSSNTYLLQPIKAKTNSTTPTPLFS
ncbi:hypothetical protein Ddc_06956 [Ditylenchus destructor]|nr:hypothetical protein Ddc_06956 [Ditylenchus destructor]